MNRKFARILFLATVALSITSLAQTQTAAAAPPAAASPAPSTAAAGARIGIINIEAAIVSTNEGKRDFEALNKKFEPKRSQLETSNKEVEGLKNQLNTQGDKLNEDARANLVRSIESKQKVLQRDLEDAQGDFTNQRNEIAQRIGAKMLEVLDKYAKDNGYSVILDVSNPQNPVLWANSATDVTKAVVDVYNAQSGVAAPPASAPSASRPGGAATKPAPAPAKPATGTGTPR